MVDEHATTYENPFKFSGKELDDITGLYDHGARSRDPKLTMWYGVDPLFEKYPDMSPYVYCHNNPVRYVDPTGMGEENVPIIQKAECKNPTRTTTLRAEIPNAEEIEISLNRYNNVPVGSEYMSEGSGGCTPAAIKSMLDFLNIKYNGQTRKKLDEDRLTAGFGADVKDYFEMLKVNDSSLKELEYIEYVGSEIPKGILLNLSKGKMYENGYVALMTADYPQEEGLMGNHTMVVNRIEFELYKNVQTLSFVFMYNKYKSFVSARYTTKGVRNSRKSRELLKMVLFRRSGFSPW